MYQLYVNDRPTITGDNLQTIKNLGFVLAAKGHKVAYMRMASL